MVAVAAAAVFIIGIVWLGSGGRTSRVEGTRFKFEVTDTRPIPIIEPEEFSDELAQTTPVPLPKRTTPRRVRGPRKAEAPKVKSESSTRGATTEPGTEPPRA